MSAPTCSARRSSWTRPSLAGTSRSWPGASSSCRSRRSPRSATALTCAVGGTLGSLAWKPRSHGPRSCIPNRRPRRLRRPASHLLPSRACPRPAGTRRGPVDRADRAATRCPTRVERRRLPRRTRDGARDAGAVVRLARRGQSMLHELAARSVRTFGSASASLPARRAVLMRCFVRKPLTVAGLPASL